MDYTVLINKNNRIPKDTKSNLVHVYSKYKDNILLEEKTYIEFKKLKNYLKEKDIDIQIESAYRTHDYQAKLISKLEKEKDIEYAKKYIAPVYHSEHESGLAIDFCIYTKNKIYEEHDMLDYKNINVIYEALNKYGFILRYPKNKEKITGYNYEPWHIRYVGLKLATYLYINNLTLEEYYNK